MHARFIILIHCFHAAGRCAQLALWHVGHSLYKFSTGVSFERRGKYGGWLPDVREEPSRLMCGITRSVYLFFTLHLLKEIGGCKEGDEAVAALNDLITGANQNKAQTSFCW